MVLRIATIWLRLICGESGLDCDFDIEGKAEEEILTKGADPAINVHDFKDEEIFFEQTPCNFLCQTLGKLSTE